MKVNLQCGSCGRKLRKGSSRRSLVFDPADGSVSLALVCLRCCLRTLSVVIPPATTIAPLCKVCKKGLASICAGCHDRSESHCRELTKSNVILRRERDAE